MAAFDAEQLIRIEQKLDILLSKFGENCDENSTIDTPAQKRADIDAIVLRFTNRKKLLKKNV